MRMRFILTMIVMLLLITHPISAQNDDCPILQKSVLLTAAQSCSTLESNTICLGHGQVESVVNCDNIPDFSQPGDTISLQAICALRLNGGQSDGQGGIVLMQVPTSQAVDLTMVLLGDLEIQNAASAASQMRVWVNQDTTIHSGPGRPYDILKTVSAGEVLFVNACNCTRHWLRTILDDGRVGWLFVREVSIMGEEDGLPVVETDTPVYESMQAFTFISGQNPESCAASGILIQAPAGSGGVPLQINGVEITLNSTIFVQSQPTAVMKIVVLDGVVQVTANRFTVTAPAGTQVIVPISADNLPVDGTTVVPYLAQEIAQLPFDLLPTAINPRSALSNPTPQIVGIEPCNVVSNQGATICPLHFVNYDGDALTRLEVIFLQAPQGDWADNVIEPPQIITGNEFSGQLAWEPSCSLGAANFIGPVKWGITLTDENGQVSPTFVASFNCVDG